MPKKSKCHHERRYSPSVVHCRPISCFLTIVSISRSSTALSSASGSLPASCLARASLIGAERRMLPTWSARNGGLVRAVIGRLLESEGVLPFFITDLAQTRASRPRQFVGWAKARSTVHTGGGHASLCPPYGSVLGLAPSRSGIGDAE